MGTMWGPHRLVCLEIPSLQFFLYSVNLSSKDVFVKAKSMYLYAEHVFVGFPFGGPFDC